MSDRSEAYYVQNDIDPNAENCSWTLMLRQITHTNPRVLDVGCSCGHLGKVLKKQFGATVFGLEFDADSIAMAHDTGAYIDIRQCDLDALSEAEISEWRGFFDCIVLGDILEHLRTPSRDLKVLLSCLKADGEIIASIPNISHMYIKAQLLSNNFHYTESGLLDKTHIHFFTYRTIAELLSENGLMISNCDFTMCGKDEWHGIDYWQTATHYIQESIFNDWHSYVCQYVVAAKPSKADFDCLLKENTERLDINENIAPKYIREYKSDLLKAIGDSQEKILRAELNDVLNSRSWRWTKPLRLAGKVARKVKRVFGFGRELGK